MLYIKCKHFTKKLHNFIKNNRGLTLIEVAVVLMIIGLISVSVLKVQNLLESAKIRSTISTINALTNAIEYFYMQYGNLPGDCNLELGQIAPGNGNNIIEGNGLQANTEAFNLWQHLSQNNLIRGIIVDENLPPEFGKNLPKCQLGGGFSILYTEVYGITGHFLVLSDINGRGILTSKQAFEIDKALDNGVPTKGIVLATGENCVEDNKYNLNNLTPCCKLFIKI